MTAFCLWSTRVPFLAAFHESCVLLKTTIVNRLWLAVYIFCSHYLFQWLSELCKSKTPSLSVLSLSSRNLSSQRLPKMPRGLDMSLDELIAKRKKPEGYHGYFRGRGRGYGPGPTRRLMNRNTVRTAPYSAQPVCYGFSFPAFSSLMSF